MPGDQVTLSALIEAIADGDSLETALAGRSLPAEEHRLMGHLRLVAAVADVHRAIEPGQPGAIATDAP